MSSPRKRHHRSHGPHPKSHTVLDSGVTTVLTRRVQEPPTYSQKVHLFSTFMPDTAPGSVVSLTHKPPSFLPGTYPRGPTSPSRVHPLPETHKRFLRTGVGPRRPSRRPTNSCLCCTDRIPFPHTRVSVRTRPIAPTPKVTLHENS